MKSKEEILKEIDALETAIKRRLDKMTVPNGELIIDIKLMQSRLQTINNIKFKIQGLKWVVSE